MTALNRIDLEKILHVEGSIAEKIAYLEDQKTEVRKLFSRLDSALADNKISNEEYSYMLKKLTNNKHEYELIKIIDEQLSRINQEKALARNPKSYGVAIVSVLLLIILLGTTLFLINVDSSITGYGTFVDKITNQAIGQTFTENGNLSFNVTNVTSVKLSGSLQGFGKANIYLVNGDERLKIISKSNSNNNTNNSIISTDKFYYVVGEEINVNVQDAVLASSVDTDLNVSLNVTNSSNLSNLSDLSQATYTLYTKNDFETVSRTSNSFTIGESGSYEVYALIDDQGVITKESTFIEVVASEEDISIDFENECLDTCTISAINNPNLEIELEGDVSLTLMEVTVVAPGLDEAPVQIKDFNDIILAQGMNTSLNLEDYFADDGELIYDLSASQDSGVTIKNNLLNINPLNPGNYLITIYASDLNEMIDDSFNLIVKEKTTNNLTSNNTVINNSNETIVEKEIVYVGINTTNSINISNMTFAEIKALGLCDEEDPNKRPSICLIEDSEKYFIEEPIYIENLDKVKVARISPIGNLLIKGNVIENSDATPGSRDFKLGYDDNFEFVTTLFIDSDTGDLHLKGNLYEENTNLKLPSNVYSFQNKRGVNFGYVVKSRGDLYIRGNLIPYRRSIE